MAVAIPDKIEEYKALSRDDKKAVFTRIWEEGLQDEVMGKWGLPKGPFTTMAVRLGVAESNPVTKQRREKAKARKNAQAEQATANESAVSTTAATPPQAEVDQVPAPKKTRAKRATAKADSKPPVKSASAAKETASSKSRAKKTTVKTIVQDPVALQPEANIAASSAPVVDTHPAPSYVADKGVEQISISAAEFAEMKNQIKKLSTVVDVLFDKINDLEKRQWK